MVSLQETVTGEEQEDVLYSVPRAKLYRSVEGAWKERGVGEFRILQHADTGRVRCVMRREGVMKVCCNHHLTPQTVLRPKDPKSFIWPAQDFADGEIRSEIFCLRFKSPDEAERFREAFDAAVASITPGQSPLAATSRNGAQDAPKASPLSQMDQLSPGSKPKKVRHSRLAHAASRLLKSYFFTPARHHHSKPNVVINLDPNLCFRIRGSAVLLLCTVQVSCPGVLMLCCLAAVGQAAPVVAEPRGGGFGRE